MLIGRYDYALDAKNRLNFPARFRAEMGETFVVTCWLDGCLVAFPASKWEDMAAQLENCNLADARAVQHKLFPNAITEVMRGGKVEHAIDFDVLRQELSDSIVEGREVVSYAT